jgi:hypothetical protein
VQLFARRVINLITVTVTAQDCYHVHRKFQYFPSRSITHVDETTEDPQCDFQYKRPILHKISVFLKNSAKWECNGAALQLLTNFQNT